MKNEIGEIIFFLQFCVSSITFFCYLNFYYYCEINKNGKFVRTNVKGSL